MSMPGLSLFQGAESIKVNTSLERREEEEDLEDQRRRGEELGLIIQNAFDDLDDDETTIDSTTNFQSGLMDGADPQHLNSHQPNAHNQHRFNEINNVYAAGQVATDHSVSKNEIHNLKMLVESHSRELDHSKLLLSEEHKRNNDLKKKLTITEAELERALANKKNNHELLVECKEKCSNLENTINKMKNEKKVLEADNNTLLGKLETAQTLLADVQRKYDMVGRDLNKHQERNFELKRKQMEDRHRAAIEILQQQMEQVSNKLDKKTSELDSMNTRYQALQDSHQMMLCDKASKINDLSHALDESQKRCEELLSRPDYSQENIRLQKLIASLQEHIQSMENTIKSLRERLEMTTAELDSMDSVLRQYNQEDTPCRVGQTQVRVLGSSPLNPVDRMGNLKEELYRAFANIKSKRDEICKLQQTVEDKQIEIKHLKQEENKSLVQISTLKEENIKLQNKLRVMDEEFDKLNSNQDQDQQEDNYLKVEELKSQLNNEIKKTVQLEQHKLQQDNDRKKLDAQLKNLEIDLEELKQEHESLKLNYEQILKENMCLKQRHTADSIRLELEKHKFLLKDSQAECDRLKNLYVEISNAKEAVSCEMDKILKSDKARELQEEKEKVANLQRTLKLVEVNCSELSKMLETEKLCHERDVADLREKLEKEKFESSKASKEAANECTKCMDYVAELTKFEIENLKLTNINAINKKEIDELTKNLKSSKEHLTELNEQLKLSEQQEHLIKELKTKATQFEEYIKTHSSASETSNSSLRNIRQVSDKSVTTSPELERNEVKKIEAKVRDEMAKIYALEIKRFQTKLLEAKEQSLCLQREYQHINAELQQRQTEVQLLKRAILADREKMNGILKEKDVEYNDIMQRQNVTIHRTRDELQMKMQKIKELTHERDERQAQIEAERKSMKAVMKQWEEQRKSLDAVEMDWKSKLTDLQKAHEGAIQSWQTKYNSAKRTAANYKRYSEDKEAHMLKEYDRLKIEYEAQLVKIQVRMRESLEKKSLELKKALDEQRILNNNNKENTAAN